MVSTLCECLIGLLRRNSFEVKSIIPVMAWMCLKSELNGKFLGAAVQKIDAGCLSLLIFLSPMTKTSNRLLTTTNNIHVSPIFHKFFFSGGLKAEPNHPLGKKDHGLERKIFRGGKILSFITSGTNFPVLKAF